MPTAIFFDPDGVLWTTDAPDEDLLATALAPHLEDPAAAAAQFRSAVDEQRGAGGSDPCRAGMAAVCEGRPDCDPGRLVEALIATAGEHTCVTLAPRESLAALADAHALGVLTDGVEALQRAILDAQGLDACLDAIVTPATADAQLSDPAQFDRARDALVAEAYVVVCASDAVVRGARRAGFVPVRVERDGDPEFWATLNALL